ncbi:MAG TPA: hypothetical protein VL100_04475 [Croceibacterium sp.]|nr:hypothetical protein [Croceibacterium sp.]
MPGVAREASAMYPRLLGVTAHRYPPGFSTRIISAATIAGSATCSNTQLE